MIAVRNFAAAAATLALTGCGITNPSDPSSKPTVAAPPSGLRAAPSQLPDALMRAAVDFTLTQATWSPDSYVAQKGLLAAASTGLARTQLATPDGQSPTAVARLLKVAGSSSRASLLGTDGPDQDRRVVVAYKTVATGSGRARDRADYPIAHVALVRQHGRWLVSNFAIQP